MHRSLGSCVCHELGHVREQRLATDGRQAVQASEHHFTFAEPSGAAGPLQGAVRRSRLHFGLSQQGQRRQRQPFACMPVCHLRPQLSLLIRCSGFAHSVRRMQVSRDKLISLGSCLGKFTHSGKFRLTIGCLDILAAHAKYKVCAGPCNTLSHLQTL